jgi:hypothetical protein
MFGLFPSQARAEEAVNRLAQAGFDPRDIGFLAPGETREPPYLKAAAAGVGTGTALGGVAGAVLGAISVGAIPGIGPVLVAGALVPVAMGLITGAGAGGTLGGLFAAALSQDQALYFTQEVRAGRSLVTVTTDRAREAGAALRGAGALDVAAMGSGQAAHKLSEDAPAEDST